MQHVYGLSGNLGKECADHAAAWGPWALPQATTLPLVECTITLMQLRVLMSVTALPRSLNGYSAVERILLPKIGVSIVFTIEFVVFVVHLTCLSGRLVFSCSQSFSFWVLVSTYK